MIKNKPDLVIKKWNKESKKKLVNKIGIYAIYFGPCMCLYVGASVNLYNRVIQAFNPNSASNTLLRIILKYYNVEFRIPHKPWVKIFFHKRKNLRELEQLYINKLKPRLNLNYIDYRTLYRSKRR